MRCVQVQEMPPNPTHWTFSGLLFSFFLDMFLLHTADSCCLEALCFQEVSFLFSSSVLESRTVCVFVVTDQKCLGCVAFAATPGSIPDADVSCHILLSPLFYVSVCLCCIINIFLKMHQEKVRGQGHYDLTPVSFLWVKYLKNASRKFQYMTQHPLKLKDDLVWFRQSKIKVTVTSHPTYSTKKKTNFYNKRLTG